MTEPRPNGAVKTRSFVAVVLLLSGLTLPVTGVVNHFYGFAPISLERHAWMSAHNGAGLLFAGFSIWHAALNARALANHLRRVGARFSMPPREVWLATLVVVATMALIVGHAFHASG